MLRWLERHAEAEATLAGAVRIGMWERIDQVRRRPETWTVIQHCGPDYLGLWLNDTDNLGID